MDKKNEKTQRLVKKKKKKKKKKKGSHLVFDLLQKGFWILVFLFIYFVF